VHNRRQTLWYLAFTLYLAAVLYLLFLRRWEGFSTDRYWQRVAGRLNLIPFASFRCFFTVARRGVAGWWQAAANLAGNVALFMPMGIFLPHFWPLVRKFGRFALAAAVEVIALETIQLLTLLGAGDIDDVLLNLMGMLLGFALWAHFRRHKKR
jgi:glycopeptide antibiotics resistance protein